MNTKEYPGVKADINQLIDELRTFFENSDYEVQVRRETPSVIVQARKSSMIRDWTGTSYALTVSIVVNQIGTQVAVGRQKWLDKAAVGAVAGILTGGSGILLGAWGAYQQYHITEKTWNVVEKHIAHKSGGSVYAPVACSGCGATSMGGRYCSTCGMEFI